MKKIVSILWITLLILSSFTYISAENSHFTDVKDGSWYMQAVSRAYTGGYIAGTGGGKFSPDADMKRCDFVTVLARYDGVRGDDYGNLSVFEDVEHGSYYAGYVNWAYENAIICGTSEGEFSPEKPITREEACVILEKYIAYCGDEIYTAKYAEDFNDTEKISPWAQNSVRLAHKRDLVSGYGGNFDPKGHLSRAQAVTVLFALDNANNRTLPTVPCDFGSERQILLEDHSVDTDASTCSFSYIAPVKKEAVFAFKNGYEFNNAIYHNIVKAPDGKYRMYYKATDVFSRRKICFLESEDGLTWKRGTGDYGYRGEISNIVTDEGYSPDNLFVFYDTNPNFCGTRWKGIYGQWGDGLFCEYSPDGLSFFCNGEEKLFGAPETNGGMFFDTLNTMFYDEARGKYVGFVRGFHEGDNYVLDVSYFDQGPDNPVRDIRYIESTDFVHWSDPVPLKYDDAGDWEMYANAISPYYRAKQLYVGLPTRLQQAGAGSYITQVYLMSSRDLINWDITEDPYMKPENSDHYIYPKSGYPCVGIIGTAEDEMSLYMAERDEEEGCQVLYRYTLRPDGFRCAGSKTPSKLVTKYAEHDGNLLEVNYKCSNGGYIRVTVTDVKGKSITSGKLIGDEISRSVFTKNELASLCPGAVKLTFDIENAEVYSYKFN